MMTFNIYVIGNLKPVLKQIVVAAPTPKHIIEMTL